LEATDSSKLEAHEQIGEIDPLHKL